MSSAVRTRAFVALASAVLTSFLGACSDRSLVVLTLEDHEGVAVNACAIVAGTKPEALVRVELGERRFPLTLNLQGVAGEQRDIWLDALDDSIGVLTRAHVRIVFPEGRTGTAHAVFGLPCDDDAPTCAATVCSTQRARSAMEETRWRKTIASPPARPTRAGDGFLNSAREECDDGNNSDEDGCLTTGTVNVCGGGVLNLGSRSVTTATTRASMDAARTAIHSSGKPFTKTRCWWRRAMARCTPSRRPASAPSLAGPDRARTRAPPPPRPIAIRAASTARCSCSRCRSSFPCSRAGRAEDASTEARQARAEPGL